MRRNLWRIALAAVLIAIAVWWPLAEIGPKGGTLITFTRRHGIDTRDLLSLIPIAFAVLLVWSCFPRQRAPERDAARRG